MSTKLEKSQTGIASEFYVAGELARLGYNVTITFGNTKSIDLLIQKELNVFKIQVKGIQSNDSICWNVDKDKITDDIFFVLINLHVDTPSAKPEFFVMKGAEVKEFFKDTKKMGSRRAYLDYNRIKKLSTFQDRWSVFGLPEHAEVI